MSVKEAEVMPNETAIAPMGRKSKRAVVKREDPGAIATDPNVLISQAMMVEGLTIQERLMLIEKVESITVERQRAAAERAFYEALSAFQRECPVIKKTKPVFNKNGGTLRYKYAPLGQIVKQVGPLLAKHGLSYDFSNATVIPFTETSGGPFLELTTNIHHEGGHSRGFPFRAVIEDTDFMNATQQAGSSNMYAKRYGFVNAFGILTADEDIDGNDPDTMITPNKARAARQPVSQPKATPTAQRAASVGNGEKPQLVPAGEGERIDAGTITGYTKAMERATLTLSDFKARFPAMQGIEQIKADPLQQKVMLGWIGSPSTK